MTNTPKPEALASLVERLNDSAQEHGGSSISNGCCDCGISANLCDEAAATITTLAAEKDALKAALTASAETKAAYMSKFFWREPDFDDCGGRTYRHNVVPWTTIKEIMAAILARTTLERTAQP